MSTVEDLREAAALVHNDKGADVFARAVAEWLLAEAITQEAVPVLVDAMNMAIKTAGGPTAYLSLGVGQDGEPAMRTSTNEHALAVVAEIRRRYGAATTEPTVTLPTLPTDMTTTNEGTP